MNNATINHLSSEEIKVVLRAADEIIARGGRTLLAKILKGSREKKVLELELDKCPVYGAFRSETLEEITKKIDWMIDYDFLAIEYSGKLPMIVFTDRGWQIEADQRADEFLIEWEQWLDEGKIDPEMSYLKDRNREMILLFLDKIKESGNKQFIPYLELWEKIDYKKVRAEIRSTIKILESDEIIEQQSMNTRVESINKALEGLAPQDFLLKCWECGDRFTFTVEEQKLYRQKGFVHPKRCKSCRRKKRYEDYF
ncbi:MULTISPECIES: RQC-minor-1 family DNA-binding protein [Sutcliffiella]|uniref:Superfamily II DNA helicase n=1 Tax=Sutcliffiella cohnii TaxID=33932 RepID=A0A223KKE9_9BACI|nr:MULTISPECIES: RQC-minor-1 family DNA-binding protein [Sutcliffiella]AST89876.1 superfamily II DNA helicase [Sutcliffiella cohnii]WBL15498.1 RQC-minor-1 family DNA-binding protein [Sutcliffiella sp. NC1]